jgi:quinol monooxygenase YgiN
VRDEAIRIASTMARATRGEAGCNRYHFAFDVEDPNLVHVIEEWASAEALAAHFQSPHMAEFQKALPGMLAGAPEFKRYEVSSAGAM